MGYLVSFSLIFKCYVVMIILISKSLLRRKCEPEGKRKEDKLFSTCKYIKVYIFMFTYVYSYLLKF